MEKKILKFFLAAILVFFLLGMVFTGCALAREEEILEELAMEPEMFVAEEAPAPERAEVMIDEAPVEEVSYESVLPDFERKIIKSAYIELEVETGSFEDNLFNISNLAEQNGGFVSDTQSFSDPEGKLTSGRIVIRIPQDRFSSVVDKIKVLGTVKNISISGQDVTQEYVDLESRLRNLNAQEKVLLDLMEKSKTVKDSIEVQRELSNVQSEIEVIKGRMNYLDNLISFSTIEVYLREPEPIKTIPGWGFVDALRRGLRGALRVINGLIFFIILVSPLIILALIIFFIVRAIVRSARRRRAEVKKE